jgi:hypothetical protein
MIVVRTTHEEDQDLGMTMITTDVIENHGGMAGKDRIVKVIEAIDIIGSALTMASAWIIHGNLGIAMKI